MEPDRTEEERVAAAVRRHARTRAFAEAEAFFTAVMADPAVQRLDKEIRAEETRLGLQLRPRFQPLQERYLQAEREGDLDVLLQRCPGNHGRWGRVCVLAPGHEATEPHWGVNGEDQPIAWVGTARTPLPPRGVREGAREYPGPFTRTMAGPRRLTSPRGGMTSPVVPAIGQSPGRPGDQQPHQPGAAFTEPT